MKRIFATLMITAFAAFGLQAQTASKTSSVDSKVSVAHMKRSEMKEKLATSDSTQAKKAAIKEKASEMPGGKKVAAKKLQRKHANKEEAKTGNVRTVNGKKVAVKRQSMNIE